MSRLLIPLAWLLASASPVWAGVFNLPGFVESGEFAAGVEPEFILTSGAGVGGNLRYTHGLGTLSNLGVTLGTGSGPKRFRFGASVSFDFFPDVDGQPGIGIAPQLLYQSLKNGGRLEATVIPYLHKAFLNGEKAVDPFVAFPVGWSMGSGTGRSISTFVVGASFKGSEHFRTIVEFGIAVNNTETYLSGGIAYYH